MSTRLKNYMTVKQASEKFPAFSQGSFRWLIQKKDTNGFASVLRKVGGKVRGKLLIEESAFIEWIEKEGSL